MLVSTQEKQHRVELSISQEALRKPPHRQCWPPKRVLPSRLVAVLPHRIRCMTSLFRLLFGSYDDILRMDYLENWWCWAASFWRSSYSSVQ